MENKKMRCLFVTPGLGLGGAERWILTLCKYFREVEVVGIYVTERVYHEVCVTEARKLGVPLLVPTERVECDVVVTWGTPMVRTHLGPTSVPIVEVSHTNCEMPGQKEFILGSCRQATHWAAVSTTAADPFPFRDRVSVIENGVDKERLQPVLGRDHYRKLWGLEPNERAVVQVGRLMPEKAPERLIGASNYLEPHWVPVFVGQGELLQDCLGKAQKTGRKIVFQGPVADVGDIYAAADVVAIPSRTEAMPLVMLEAWLAKRPVVATSFQNAVDMVQRFGRVAELVPIDHRPAELAGAIMRAASHDTEWPYSVALEHYTGEAMAKRWEVYLESVVSRKADPCVLT